MKVSDIIPDTERLKELDKFTRYKQKELMRKFYCNSCYEVATKLVKYQVGDKEQKAIKIERYCQRHYELVIKNT